MYTSNNKARYGLTLFALLIIALFPLISSTAALADESITFGGSQPADALENENYTWKITVKGGTPPYSCGVTGALPPGLMLDNEALTISGKPARGTTSDRYTFRIKITDSSDPAVSIEAPFTINVQYRSTIAIDPALSGETNVYVDGKQITKLRGGGTTSVTFPAGTKHTISVDVSSPSGGNVRLKPTTDKIVVDGLSPDATFAYSSEYDIHIKSNLPNVPAVPGSGWYKPDSLLESVALAQVEPKPGTQYRFSHWLLPTGEVLGDAKLSWKVTKPGDVIANYDTYYQLTVNSEYCDVEGADWYKAGSTAKWSVTCSQSVPVPGFWGNLGAELKPVKYTGTVLMDSPEKIDIEWKADYSKLFIPTATAISAAAILAIFGILHERSKRVVAKIKEKRASRGQ